MRAGVYLGFLSAVVCVWSGSAGAVGFQELLERARAHDPVLRLAQQDAAIAGLGREEALAGLRPAVVFAASRQNTDQAVLESQNKVFEMGRARYPSSVYGLTITQPLFRLGAWRRIALADAQIERAELDLAHTEQELVVRIATAWIAVLAARDARDLARSELRAIEAQLKLIDEKVSAGVAPRLAASEVRGRHELKRADLEAAEIELGDRYAAIEEICGVLSANDRQALLPIGAALAFRPPEPDSPDSWREASLTGNLLIKSRLKTVEAAGLEIERQRGAYAPSVDLVIGSNRRATEGSLFGGGSTVRTGEVSFNFNYPLYEGKLTDTLVAQANLRRQSAEQQLERVRRLVDRQTGTLFQAVRAGLARIAAFEASVLAFEQARDLRRVALEAGVASVIPFLDAERDLFKARRDLAQARYDLVLNGLRLRQTAGLLDQSDIDHLNAITR